MLPKVMDAVRVLLERVIDEVRAFVEDTRQLWRDWPDIRSEIVAHSAGRREG